MAVLIPKKGVSIYPGSIFYLPLQSFSFLVINSMIFLVVVVDLATWLYQEIYFTINDIPKIKRSQYVIMTRHKLKGLNASQKWSCWYCEYVNSVVAWVKAVTNQTEIYSCGIKYSHHFPGQQYQEDFYEQEQFAEQPKK